MTVSTSFWWNILLQLAKKWPEIVVKWLNQSLVSFICVQTILYRYFLMPKYKQFCFVILWSQKSFVSPQNEQFWYKRVYFNPCFVFPCRKGHAVRAYLDDIQMALIRTINMAIGTNNWDVETYRNKLKNISNSYNWKKKRKNLPMQCTFQSGSCGLWSF